jgi:hypothetical protein
MAATAVIDTPEKFWDLQRTSSSIARQRLLTAPPAALRAEFLRTCWRVQVRGGKLVYPYAAFFVPARRQPV